MSQLYHGCYISMI